MNNNSPFSDEVIKQLENQKQKLLMEHNDPFERVAGEKFELRKIIGKTYMGGVDICVEGNDMERFTYCIFDGDKNLVECKSIKNHITDYSNRPSTEYLMELKRFYKNVFVEKD